MRKERMMTIKTSLVPTVKHELENTIKQDIDRRTARRLHQVEVHCNENQVIVKGKARSYYIRQLALASVLNSLTNWAAVEIVDKIRMETEVVCDE